MIAPQTLDDLLLEVSREGDFVSDAYHAMMSVLRRHHFWPALQLKKINGTKLLMLHNTYTRVDVHSFQALYDECRSVILDLSVPIGQNVVVTYAQSIPKRLAIGQYAAIVKDDDICTISYEGTVITVYHYDDKWHFGTSTCPSVDSSRYQHPVKTHGIMFDEAIAKIVGEEDDVREKFTARLDTNLAYAFILVHHENKHIMDYTTELGEDYAVIYQINTINRMTLEEVTDPDAMVVEAPMQFCDGADAIAYLNVNPDSVYGIFVKHKDGSLLKVSSDEIVYREERDLGSSNIWQNMLHVYMKRFPDFQIREYLSKYHPTLTLQLPLSMDGRQMAPSHIIHTAMCALRDVLLKAYRDTTYYDVPKIRYVIRRNQDKELQPTLKFHVSQLRHIQITDYTEKPIGSVAVRDYLCHHNTIKNIRLLLDHMSKNPPIEILSVESMQCVHLLDKLLKH
jgi:hypothetical protein